MATIHAATLTPTKLELLARWLPAQAWYRGRGTPALAKVGGFRLDDPDGEVGIEIMLVADADGTTYVVPMSYRGGPLDGADEALLGTSEHSVLGSRWIYDGAADPVVVAQLRALVRGDVRAQHQDVSDTPDDSVTAGGSDAGDLVVVRVVEGTARGIGAGEGADDPAVDDADGGDVRGWVAMEVPLRGGGSTRRRVVVVH